MHYVGPSLSFLQRWKIVSSSILFVPKKTDTLRWVWDIAWMRIVETSTTLGIGTVACLLHMVLESDAVAVRSSFLGSGLASSFFLIVVVVSVIKSFMLMSGVLIISNSCFVEEKCCKSAIVCSDR